LESDSEFTIPCRSEVDRRQHDHINYYYEQKEKFVKRFLNRDSKENKDQICQIGNQGEENQETYVTIQHMLIC